MTILTKQQQRETRQVCEAFPGAPRPFYCDISVQGGKISNALVFPAGVSRKAFLKMPDWLAAALDTLDLADRIAAWAAGLPCIYFYDERPGRTTAEECGTCGPDLARRWVKERGE